jgi:hypothetical protein
LFLTRSTIRHQDCRRVKRTDSPNRHRWTGNDSGQKVHNLRVAVTEVDPQSEVLVFVDTDARRRRTGSEIWSRRSQTRRLALRLVIAGSFRAWGIASRLRGVWNASVASALGSDTRKTSAGVARLRSAHDFQSLNVSERWRGTVSDDFTITRVLKKRNFRFTSRQLSRRLRRRLRLSRAARVHHAPDQDHARLRLTSLAASTTRLRLFAIAFFGGFIC